MPTRFDFKDLVISDRLHLDDLVAWFPRRPTVRILVVADTAVSFTSSFGIGKMVDLIRTNADGYVHFDVDLAVLGTNGSQLGINAAPGPRDPKYTNFRFSSQAAGQHVIAGYDEIWCFGFAPGNDGSSNDQNIWNSPYASTDGDLAVLTRWMNDGGGVLAMGDHHYLGAAMCARIPRVRSMRRWTNAQAVPPIGGPGRFDTNRPQDASQDPNVTPNPAQIPFEAQQDAVAQVIDWKRYSVWSMSLLQHRYRPHPILCGGDLGVIDVLPDHPHEGWVYDDQEIPLAQPYQFGAETGAEYPKIGSVQPRPEAVAWANTLPDPPYVQFKGDSPAKRFAVIGVYDGDAVDVGRVVVDSTWHHWFDINLIGLEAETPQTEFEKIARYYRNCAVWLAREGQRRQMFVYTTFFAALHAASYEDLNAHTTLFVLGGQAIDVIGRFSSDCVVREWIDLFLDVRLREQLIHPPVPHPEPCWSCPPLDLARHAVLGGVIQAIVPLRDELLLADPKKRLQPTADAVVDAAELGAHRGLQAFGEAIQSNVESLGQLARLDCFALRRRRPRS